MRRGDLRKFRTQKGLCCVSICLSIANSNSPFKSKDKFFCYSMRLHGHKYEGGLMSVGTAVLSELVLMLLAA